jgi:hypothetical protein
MHTHSRIAELTLQLSGRLARPGQNPRAQRTGHWLGSALSNPQSERPHSAARQFERLRQRTIRWRSDAH